MPKEIIDTLPAQCLDILRKSGPMTHLGLHAKLGGAAKHHPSDVYRAAKNHPDIVADYSIRGVLTFTAKEKV